MNSTIYIDPWRGRIRALEHNIVKYRAMQMTLAIYYAEEIRRVVISAIQTQDKFSKSLKPNETSEDDSLPDRLREHMRIRRRRIERSP